MSEQEAVARVLSAVLYVSRGSGLGTGVIIDRAGLAITNQHVVRAERQVEVRLQDRRTFMAIVERVDEQRDLALLRLPVGDLPTATLGDPDALRLGEPLVAIGYALNLPGSPTVTRGLFSAPRIVGGVEYVQTDAAINPGNSRRPLLSLKGEVVGINTWGITGDAGSPVQGVNFAISSRVVRQFLADSSAAVGRPGTSALPASSGPSMPNLRGTLILVRPKAGGGNGLEAWRLGGADEPRSLSAAGSEWDWAPSASPDGQWLAFATGSPGKAVIAVMRRDGTARRVIAESPEISFGSPAWASNNERLGFGGSWGSGFGEIFTATIGGTRVVQVTDTPEIEGTRIPTWPRSGPSPLAFTGKQEGIWRVFVLPTGGQPRAITPAGAQAYAPAWSPDGTRLAFQGNDVQGMAGIFTMAPDGSDVRSVVRSGGGVWTNAPIWSPDGQWLAYVSNREASIGTDYGDLYIVPASGGQSTRLTSDGRTYDWRAAWLP